MGDLSHLADPDARKKLQFVPVIRLGDILTAATMLFAAGMAYTKIDGRVLRLEEVTAEQKVTSREVQNDIRRESADLRGAIQRVEDKLERIRK